MIHRPTFLLLASLSGSLPTAPAAGADPENLLANGGFEDGRDGEFPPPGWAIWGDRKDKLPERFVLDPANPRSGKRSLRIDHPAGTHAYPVSDPRRPIRTRAGRAYRLTFWARTADLEEPGIACWETPDDGPSPGRWPIRPSPAWTRHEHEIHEGVDFFARDVPEILIAFRPARSPDARQTLWIDDVTVTEVPSARERLLDPREIAVPPLNHRFRPGPALDFTVDAGKRLGEAAARAAGQSFHRLAGHGRHPYDLSGRFVLDPRTVEAIRRCRLPMTRFYGTGAEPWPIEETLEKLGDLVDRVGVPRSWTVLELEPQDGGRKLPPESWAAAAGISARRGLGFRLWEISNEPSTRKATAFVDPDDYVAHAVACSRAIKAVQPDARVGIAIDPASPGWGNGVLKRAAGRYDFVVGHYYAEARGGSLEEVALEANYRILDRVRLVGALIAAYNPGRTVDQIDTEWDVVGAGPETGPARHRNGNIWAAVHRAVRLIYYARERLVAGASGWEMFCRAGGGRAPPFGFLTLDDPDRAFVTYWMYALFNRHCGRYVLDVDGTAPWWPPAGSEGRSGSGPATPVLATLAEDGGALFLVIANGSAGNARAATARLKGFPATSAAGAVIAQDDPDAPGLVAEEEVRRPLAIEIAAGALRFTVPARSVAFVRAEAAPGGGK